MSEYAVPDDAEEPFEVSPDPRTAAADPTFESANVLRAGALSSMFGDDPETVRSVADVLAELGFAERLASGEQLWAGRERQFPRLLRAEEAQARRQELWQRLNESATPQDANAFLLAVLGSRLERESAAAAAALWRQTSCMDFADIPPGAARFIAFRISADLQDNAWFASAWNTPLTWPDPGGDYPDGDDEPASVAWDGRQWTEIYDRLAQYATDPYTNAYLISLLVGRRLNHALRSTDAVTRSLARAAFLPTQRVNGSAGPPSPSRPSSSPLPPAVSTMIHGTWAWKGDWWRPGPGSFHEYVLQNHRPNLYRPGTRFSWSGALRRGDRKRAAAALTEWTDAASPPGLQTVFAHSYGGEVAARAVHDGLKISELVLLSTPATRVVRALTRCSGIRVVDVRLRFDPVLALARTRQRMPSDPVVTRVILRAWRLDHAATHQVSVWRAENVAKRGAL